MKEIRRYGGTWFDDWSNMLVFGDNLRVMKSLLEMKGKRPSIRLAYIDPPFSSNHDFRSGSTRTSTISSSEEDKVAYSDTLVGSSYLEFLRKRLILIRELLAEDGSIYVHIDWKMGHYVKVIMDEVFGQEHFVNDIARVKCNPKNFDRKGYGNIRDMILFYSKSDNYVWNGSLQDYSKEQIERLFPKVDGQGKRYTTNPLHAPGETKNGATGQPWRDMFPPKGRHWRYPPEVLEELDQKGLIEWSSKGNPRKKIFADDYQKRKTKRQDIWEFKDPPYPTYPTEKNLEMLNVIVEASSNPGDIVLDCFAGSGTTLLAAELAGRKWIGIDDSPVAIRSALKRVTSIEHYSPFALSVCSDASSSEACKEIFQKEH